MPLILGANSLAGGGYEIDNSLRFNDGSSDYLNKTFGSAGNRKTWTFSTWLKRSDLITSRIFSTIASGVDDYIKFDTSHRIEWGFDHEDLSNRGKLITNRVFRDVSAWYHIVCAVDTTNATAGNRMRIYINGVEETSFATDTNPTQNEDGEILNANPHFLSSTSSAQFYDGYMADVYMIGGQQLTPSDFGEFDEDSGIWKPIAYTGSYGTNGFFLKFQNSAALGTDSSGNGNTFTVNNLTSIDQTTDTPTNNFATMNPLDKTPFGTSITYSDGNTTTTASAGTDWTTRYSFSSLAITQGKWYAECKVGNVGVSNQFYVGVIKDRQTASISTSLGGIANGYGYYANTGNIVNNGVDLSTSGASYTTNNIIGMALDLDNGTLDFYKDGVAQGDQVTGLDTSALWQFANNAYQNAIWNWNFGNPPFAITTGNEDANGYGNFEHEVPSGYYALCTKNLAEYG
jgi:hypothetical protein